MTLPDWLTWIERIGLPTAFAAGTLWVLFLLIRFTIRGIRDRLALEKKYTECREELAEVKGQYYLLTSQAEMAVDAFLDDTQNYDHEVHVLKQQIIRLTQERDELAAKLHPKSRKDKNFKER